DASVGLLMSDGEGGLAQPVAASDTLAAHLDERQVTLGEGPASDVIAGHDLVRVADLTAAEQSARWPIFSDIARERGVHACVALPLQAGVVELGVLTIYRKRPGLLSSDAFSDALAYADAALALALDHYIELPLHRLKSLDELFAPPRSVIHQASGMVSVQLGVSLAAALARLRAYAYTNDHSLADVAKDVVARRLRFDNGRS